MSGKEISVMHRYCYLATYTDCDVHTAIEGYISFHGNIDARIYTNDGAGWLEWYPADDGYHYLRRAVVIACLDCGLTSLQESTVVARRDRVLCADCFKNSSEEKVNSPTEFSHYFKDVSHLDSIDVYRVLSLFEVTDPCLQHAVKKLLVAGGRGGKDAAKDVKEAVVSLERYSAMRSEDGR